MEKREQEKLFFYRAWFFRPFVNGFLLLCPIISSLSLTSKINIIYMTLNFKDKKALIRVRF